MGLDFNFTGIKEYTELHKDKAELNKTQMIVWLTLILGVPIITQKNTEMIFKRFRLYSQLFNLYSGLLNLQDFERRIGLATNSSTLTNAQFKSLICRRIKNDFDCF